MSVVNESAGPVSHGSGELLVGIVLSSAELSAGGSAQLSIFGYSIFSQKQQSKSRHEQAKRSIPVDSRAFCVAVVSWTSTEETQ